MTQIPLIGQNDQVAGALRLQLAVSVLPALAAADFASALQKQALQGEFAEEPPEMTLRTGLVAGAAVGYADRLLQALGIVRPPDGKK